MKGIAENVIEIYWVMDIDEDRPTKASKLYVITK